MDDLTRLLRRGSFESTTSVVRPSVIISSFLLFSTPKQDHDTINFNSSFIFAQISVQNRKSYRFLWKEEYGMEKKEYRPVAMSFVYVLI